MRDELILDRLYIYIVMSPGFMTYGHTNYPTSSKMPHIAAILGIALLTSAVTADAHVSSCITSYAPPKHFSQGPTTTECYDTSHYKIADQGNLQGAGDKSLILQWKCEESCTADSRCKDIIGATQFAADSDLATGVCFFYDHTPVPRKCTDTSKRALRAASKITNCVVSY